MYCIIAYTKPAVSPGLDKVLLLFQEQSSWIGHATTLTVYCRPTVYITASPVSSTVWFCGDCLKWSAVYFLRPLGVVVAVPGILHIINEANVCVWAISQLNSEIAIDIEGEKLHHVFVINYCTGNIEFAIDIGGKSYVKVTLCRKFAIGSEDRKGQRDLREVGV